MDVVGGWKLRIIVEDMDLVVCVGFYGWKFVYFNDFMVIYFCKKKLSYYLVIIFIN